jgi:hypothetical protein
LFRDDSTVQIYERGTPIAAPRLYRTGQLFSLRVIVVAGLPLASYARLHEELHATQSIVPKFPLVGRMLLKQNIAKIIEPTITPLTIPEAETIDPKEMEGLRLRLTRKGKPVDHRYEVGFNIYRSTDPNLPKDQWRRLNESLLTETSFADKSEEPGVGYYYYITAVNAYGLESPPSDMIFGGVKPLKAPTELTEAIEKIKQLTPELIAHLRNHEDDLIKVNPRVFEHLIAEFFASWGFDDVRLVGTNPRTSADIYVVKTVNPLGIEFRYFIEVKRWKDKVGIEVINQVLGAMIGEKEQFGWHAAMIVSVGGFAEFEKWDRQQLKLKGIELKDKQDLLKWLQDYKESSSGLWLPDPPKLI